MIKKDEILEILRKYDPKKVRIGTICSHTALQIFHGARQEGFRTVGIITQDRKFAYEAFPLGKPDEYIIVENCEDLISERSQKELRNKNLIHKYRSY